MEHKLTKNLEKKKLKKESYLKLRRIDIISYNNSKFKQTKMTAYELTKLKTYRPIIL